MKKLLLFLTGLLIGYPTFAQDLEGKIFNLACRGILQTDSFLKVNAKMKDLVYVVADPLTDSSYINYPAKPWNKYVVNFSRRSKKEQMTILNSEQIPIVPLTDVVYVVDTSHFFSKGDFYSNGTRFKLLNDASELKILQFNSYLFLQKVGVRDNTFILGFTFPQSDIFYSVSLKLESTGFKLINTSVLHLKTRY